jgi:urease accessory protein
MTAGSVTGTGGPKDDDDLTREEIRELEERLAKAKFRLEGNAADASSPTAGPGFTSQSNHFLLLLSDSALPLGSFAFSSGLESYLAHTRVAHISQPEFGRIFLPLSVSSYAATTLPFLLAAHRNPEDLEYLDDAHDAALMCTVGRRASVAQGRALLGIWERSFASSGAKTPRSSEEEVLRKFGRLLRISSAGASSNKSSGGAPPPVSAHLAPLYGAVARLVGLSLEQTAYVFVLGHIKALVSAAVRASMFGPYRAQQILASTEVQSLIAAVIEREWHTSAEEAGQTEPVMDLWIGRHEMLYSRIFNS